MQSLIKKTSALVVSGVLMVVSLVWAPLVSASQTLDEPVARNDTYGYPIPDFPFPSGTDVPLPVTENDKNKQGAEVVIVSQPTHGTASVQQGSQVVIFHADAGYSGYDKFRYRLVSPEGEQSNIARVGTLVEANYAPTARNDRARVRAGLNVNIYVLNNDTDPDDDILSARGPGNPQHGLSELVWLEDGSNYIKYTPDPGFIGKDVWYYDMYDGIDEHTVSAKITVNVE